MRNVFGFLTSRAEMTAPAIRTTVPPPVEGGTLALRRKIARTHTTEVIQTVFVSGRAVEIDFSLCGVAFCTAVDYLPTRTRELRQLSEHSGAALLLGIFAGRAKKDAPATFVVGDAFAPEGLLAHVQTFPETQRPTWALRQFPGTKVAFLPGNMSKTVSSESTLWEFHCDRPGSIVSVAFPFVMAAPFIGKERDSPALRGRLTRFGARCETVDPARRTVQIPGGVRACFPE